MTRLALLTSAALLLLGAPGSAADRCSKPGAHTVQQNAQARVFYVKGKGEVKKRFYGCLRGRAPIALTRNFTPRDIENETAVKNTKFQLTGGFVAWVQESFSDFGVGEFGRTIEERSLGHRHRKVSQDVTDYDRVAALRVRGDGAVAWVLGARAPYAEIDAVESTGSRPVPIAYARGIDAQSLHFDAAALHWTQDGADHSAAVR